MDTTFVRALVTNTEFTTENNEAMFSFETEFGTRISVSKEDMEQFYLSKPLTVEVNYFMTKDSTPKIFYLKTYGSESLKVDNEVIMVMLHYMIFKALSSGNTPRKGYAPEVTSVHKPTALSDETLDFMANTFTAEMYEGYVVGEIHHLCNGSLVLAHSEREQKILHILEHVLSLTDLSDMETNNKFVHKAMALKMNNGLKLTLSDVATTLLTKDWLLTYYVMMYQLSKHGTFM